MRAICNVCNYKEKCPYVLRGKESDCIDVQTSDYGYEEAVDKACEWWRKLLDTQGYAVPSVERIVDDFRKAME